LAPVQAFEVTGVDPLGYEVVRNGEVIAAAQCVLLASACDPRNS
jgi:hypothetical protein